MRDNVKIVGILNIVLGSFGVLIGLAVLMIFGGIASWIGMTNDRDAAAAMPVLALAGTALAVFLFVLSVPSIIGGWGMLKFRPWARVLMIIVSVLNLLHFPIGTALGVYGLIVLLNDETRRLFETGGAYVPPPMYAGQAPYGQPRYGQPGGYPPPQAQPEPSYPPTPPPTAPGV
ncbi:MAG: hypothetical protein JO340_09980 [Acidobacteriaceae bacterium]|nr:hypothetical protein [Acidobacteriaceae bacterium]